VVLLSAGINEMDDTSFHCNSLGRHLWHYRFSEKKKNIFTFMKLVQILNLPGGMAEAFALSQPKVSYFPSSHKL
jgi:hypothetical protein